MSKLSLGVERMSAKPAEREYGPEVAVARLAQADRAIAEAITATEAVKLVATAKALDEWARAVRAGQDHERQAAVFVLRAKRHAGVRIEEGQARGEIAKPGERPNVIDADISKATLEDLGVSRNEASQWKALARDWTDEALTAAASEMERPSLAGIQARAPGMFTSETPEWYTPAHIVTAVVDVLGVIDLDPCADPGRGIPAGKHFIASDDGLAQEWHGRIYMNPPYGREIGEWVEKLAAEHAAGRVKEAIALVPARVDTTWWRRLPFDQWLAVTGRLAFSGFENPAPFPSAVCYIGWNWSRFRAVFGPLGDGYSRWAA